MQLYTTLDELFLSLFVNLITKYDDYRYLHIIIVNEPIITIDLFIMYFDN